MTPGWGKVKDVAVYLGLSERTVRSMIKVGILAYSKLPSGTILIKYSDADECIKKFQIDGMDKQIDLIVSEVIGDAWR